MKLYEITDQYNAALSGLSEIEDLPQDAIDDTLEGIEGEFKDKAVNVAAFIKNLEAEARAIKDAEKSMADRRRSIESHANRLARYLLMQMQMTGIDKIEDSPFFKISLRNNPAKIVVDDEAKIASGYIVEKVVKSVNKQAIKMAIESGETVEGAHIERGQRIEIK